MAGTGEEEKKISTSDFLASAKIVAEAAQSGFGKDSKLDKDKAAEAAGDVLDGISQYAKLDEQKGLGQYVDKAADYLHQYENTAAATTAAAPAAAKPDEAKSGGDDAAKSESGGGGLGGLAKVAGGFFK